MQLAMREWRQMGKWRGLLSAVAIGALLGVTGPFGSQTSLAPAVRYSFWMIIALAGFGAAAAAERVFPYVALVQLLIARVISPDDPMTVAASVDQPAAAPEYPTEFVSKLPAALRRDILALEAEDHYVRVHTLHGSALILMRLADAAALIDPRLGLRVHRSWWVAKDGVRALEGTHGRAVARLVDGTAVPISRRCLPSARTALKE